MDQYSCSSRVSTEYYNKILKPYNMEKCNPSTVPGIKKPPIAAQPLDKEQHSMFRTAVGQYGFHSCEWTFLSQLRNSVELCNNQTMKT
eukprot:6406691-Amphidinium_carterae.1